MLPGMGALPTPPFGHETWFVHDVYPYDWGFASSSSVLALLAVAVAITVAVRLAARRWPGVDVPVLARLAPWMPFAVRLHVGISLLGLLGLGDFLSPAMALHKDVVGVFLGAAMAVVTIGLVSGFHARAAGIALIAIG